MKRRKRRKTKRDQSISKRKARIVTVLAPKTAGHTAEATAANKAAMISALSLGMGPGEAAEAIGIGRSTAFAWKKDDPEFSAKWDEARETAWDKLEGRMYSIGYDDGDVAAIEKTLKAYRPERWREPKGDHDRGVVQTEQVNNYFISVPMQEQLQRLERLGLPAPVIESDSEEDYAPTDGNHSP
jgi:hypothetical protein